MTYGPPQPTVYPPAPPPRPARGTGLVVGVVAAVAAVLVLGVGAVILVVAATNRDGGPSRPAASGGAGPGEADLRATAQAYVDAVNQGDEAAATSLTCQRADPGTLYVTGSEEARTKGWKWEIREVEVLGDGTGTVRIAPEGNPGPGVPTPFDVRDGAWCTAV